MQALSVGVGNGMRLEVDGNGHDVRLWMKGSLVVNGSSHLVLRGLHVMVRLQDTNRR
jgi:hypothetical protein